MLLSMEQSILDWIQNNFRCAFLDAVLPAISRMADHGEIWILLAVCLLLFRRTRRAGLSVAFALMLDLLVCNLWLKPLIGRLRPFALSPEVVLLILPPGDASFPSGHTAASFAAVAALKTVGSPLWKPALPLAAVMAFSRLYLYVHWPSDILGGILLGAAAGWLGGRLAQKIRKQKYLV